MNKINPLYDSISSSKLDYLVNDENENYLKVARDTIHSYDVGGISFELKASKMT